MRIDRVIRHERSVADAYAMASSKPFQERKCVDAGALSFDVSVEVDGDTSVVRTKRKLPTVGFPSLVRKVVPGGVTSTETIRWGAAGADGSRTADLHVDFHGAPAKMNGTIRLVPEGDGGSAAHIEADFVVHVPLVGGKVEKLSAPLIQNVLDAEQATGLTWVGDPV